RPHELWPKRAMKFEDASRQARLMVAELEQRGYLRPAEDADERDGLINDVAMNALARFDETLRALALERYREFEAQLGPVLTRFTLEEALRRFDAAGILHWPDGVGAGATVDELVKDLAPDHGRWLARNPALEDVTKLCQEAARHLTTAGALRRWDSAKERWQEVEPAAALALHESPLRRLVSGLAESLGAQGKTFPGEVLP